MKKIIYIFSLFLFISIRCPAQQSPQRDIQQIKITDTVLLQQIHKMIKEMPTYGADYFKKGYGYIDLYIQRFSPNSDTTMVYYLHPTLNSLEERNVDEVYPDFYDIIDNKLVTINIDALNQFYFSKRSFTDNSKKMMRELMDKHAAPTLIFDDGKGHRDEHARIYYLMFGGIKIFLFRNKPPLIKKVQEG